MANQQEILEAIRAELTAIKVPDADTAQPDTTWERARRRLARPRRARQGAGGPLRRPDRRSGSQGHCLGRRRDHARRAPPGRERPRPRLWTASSSPDGASSPPSPRASTRSSTPCSAWKAGSPTRVSPPCAEFDPEVVMTPKEARRMDRFTQLAVAAADQAADEAGLLGEVDPARVGVHRRHRRRRARRRCRRECKTWLEEGDRAVSPLFVPMMMPNAAAGQIAMRRGAARPGLLDRQRLRDRRARDRRGRADDRARRGRRHDLRRHRGGARRPVPGGLQAHGRAVARRRVAPVRHAPRRLRHGRGLRGPGPGARGARTRPRRATIYARVTGYGASNDAFHITQPDENGRGAIEAMTAALRDADLAPAGRRLRQRARHEHADQRPRRDARARARSSARTGRRSPRCKGAVGHTLGAAGAIEALACVEALRRGALPPTLGLEEHRPRVRRRPHRRRAARGAGSQGRPVQLVCLRRPERDLVLAVTRA